MNCFPIHPNLGSVSARQFLCTWACDEPVTWTHESALLRDPGLQEFGRFCIAILRAVHTRPDVQSLVPDLQRVWTRVCSEWWMTRPIHKFAPSSESHRSRLAQECQLCDMIVGRMSHKTLRLLLDAPIVAIPRTNSQNLLLNQRPQNDRGSLSSPAQSTK